MGSKNPMIIYDLCEECGKCVQECEYGVFGKEPSKRPEVKNPDACIDDCYECADVCPADAVMYFGTFSEGGCGGKESGGCKRCGGSKSCGNFGGSEDED